MRKVVLYIAVSLDGYIADKDGGVGWLEGDGSDTDNKGSYEGFYETVDTIIIGYKTYHQIRTELFPDGWVYTGRKSYVITHNKLESTEEIIFTDKELDVLIDELKQEDGKDIWICGGASILNPLIACDRIDQYVFTLIPVILGRGVRLFSSHEKETKLKLISTRSYNGMTDLVYERRN